MAKVLKPVPASKQKSLGKLPTAVRNKMGFQKDGGKLKKQAAIAIAKKAAGKKPKKAQDGVFAPITVKKAKLDSVLNKRRASMDSTRAAFSRKLDSARAKINAPKKKAMGGTKMMKMGGKCRGGCY